MMERIGRASFLASILGVERINDDPRRFKNSVSQLANEEEASWELDDPSSYALVSSAWQPNHSSPFFPFSLSPTHTHTVPKFLVISLVLGSVPSTAFRENMVINMTLLIKKK